MGFHCPHCKHELQYLMSVSGDRKRQTNGEVPALGPDLLYKDLKFTQVWNFTLLTDCHLKLELHFLKIETNTKSEEFEFRLIVYSCHKLVIFDSLILCSYYHPRKRNFAMAFALMQHIKILPLKWLDLFWILLPGYVAAILLFNKE